MSQREQFAKLGDNDVVETCDSAENKEERENEPAEACDRVCRRSAALVRHHSRSQGHAVTFNEKIAALRSVTGRLSIGSHQST